MIFKSGIFSVPIYKLKVARHQEIKNKFIEDFLTDKGFEPNNPVLNLQSDYFDGAKKLDDAAYLELYRKDLDKMQTKAGFTKDTEWGENIHMWYNISSYGSQQELHQHCGGFPTVVYSAIHYLIFDPQKHKPTAFFNPLYESLVPATHPSHDHLPDDWKDRIFHPEIEEGDMIIFPSYLKHAVEFQQSEEIRATIALNIAWWDKNNVRED